MTKLFLALAFILASGLAQAQTPAPAQPAVFVWKIVLKNVFNHIQAVRPEQYPDRESCELARVGMGEADIQVLGYHGECVYVPTTFGHKLGRRHHR
jgi:hypothetical protein